MRVSDASTSGRAKGSNPETGVLANLPRTRPQRASARRTAARKAATATAKAGETTAKAPRRASAKAAVGREETVPRQGFEPDGELASGSVQPPGASELVSSAAELAGELAKAGVTGGARLLKDLFARLPPG